jgi:hypothetical protein
LLDYVLDAFAHELDVDYETAAQRGDDVTTAFRTRSFAIGQFVGACDVYSLHPDAALHAFVDAFARAVRTKYVFVFRARESTMLAGTREFAALPAVERCLLVALVRSVPHAHVVDVPVFLPRTSPATPYRFVALELVANMFVGILIGKDPFVTDVIAEVRTLVPFVPLVTQL